MPNMIEYKDWLFLEVGKQICNPQIGSQSLVYINSSDYSGPIVRVPLVGSYQIIGKGDALGSDQWKEIVEHHRSRWHEEFKDYVEDGYWFLGKVAPTESGYSLLRSLGMEPGTVLILKKKS